MRASSFKRRDAQKCTGLAQTVLATLNWVGLRFACAVSAKLCANCGYKKLSRHRHLGQLRLGGCHFISGVGEVLQLTAEILLVRAQVEVAVAREIE